MLVRMIVCCFGQKMETSKDVECVVYLGGETIKSKKMIRRELTHQYQNIKRFQGTYYVISYHTKVAKIVYVRKIVLNMRWHMKKEQIMEFVDFQLMSRFGNLLMSSIHYLLWILIM